MVYTLPGASMESAYALMPIDKVLSQSEEDSDSSDNDT